MLLAVVTALPGSTSALLAQTRQFDAQAYVDKAIALVRNNALASDSVDWKAVTAEMHRRAASAHNAFDLWPALNYLTEQLHDGHSFLQLAGDLRAAYQAAEGTPFHYVSSHRCPVEKAFVERTNVTGVDVKAGHGQARWIVVPGFMGSKAESAAFVRKISGNFASKRCGYIVDFRGNTGGNMWPMLAGLSPLLHNGNLGAFISLKERDTVFLRNGAAGMRTEKKEQIISSETGWRVHPRLQSIPLAILIDGGSASSGEIVPIMLRGRAHTRFFGTPTYGISTATSGFPLPDGANLVVATSKVADRSGKVYSSGLIPDVVVKYDPDAGRDDPLNAARNWLAQQPSCRR
jgi:hypothetical protein